MPTAVELPANFRSISELSNAVDSSLHSVSSGIQAAQTSGLTHIADSLQSFDAFLPPIGSPPQSLHSLSDAGAVASPEHYLNQANEFVGKDVLKSFSNLAPMNEVLQKLMDPNLEQQKSLRGFSDLLSNFNLPGVPPGEAPSSKGLDGGIAHEFKHAEEFKVVHESKHAPDFKVAHEWKYAPDFKYHEDPLNKILPGQAGDVKMVRFDDPGFTPKISGEQRDIDPGFAPGGFGDADSKIDPGFTPNLPGDATAEKWVPSDQGFTPKIAGGPLRDIDPGFAPKLSGDAFAYKPVLSDPGFTPNLPGDATAEKWVPSDAGFMPNLPGDAIGDKAIPSDPGFIPNLPGDAIGDKAIPSDPGFIPNLPGDAITDKMVPSDPGFTPKITDGSLREMDPGFVPAGNTIGDDAQRVLDLKNTLQNIVALNQQISEF